MPLASPLPEPSTTRVALRLGRGQVQVRLPYGLEEALALGVLEAVPLPTPLAGEADLDRHVDQDRQVGQRVVRREVLQPADLIGVDAIGGALVGERRVKVAGADHVVAALEGRNDDARSVLGARGGEEQRVSTGIEVVGDVALETAQRELAAQVVSAS